MPSISYALSGKLWRWEGNAAWTFVTLPKAQAREIKAVLGGGARGFGSLPVSVRCGGTAWRTSIFPDSKRGSYVLPVKAAVRKAEGLADGKTMRYELTVEA